MSLLGDVNAQKSDDYFRGLGFDKGRQGASDYLAQQRDAQGGLTLEEKQARQTAANLQAVQPAVTSLEAGIPEVKQAYTTRQSQLTAEKDPLIQRYQQLLDQIQGRETSQVNDVSRDTTRELGRRGITSDSTFASQQIQGVTAPIHSQAQSDILSTTFDREANLRQIDNSITNLTSEMVQAERDIRNSIAQIQATAGSQGVAQALQLYQIAQEQRKADLDRLQAAKEAADTNATNAAKINAPTSSVQEIGGRKVLITYDAQGNVTNRTDLGASGSGTSTTGNSVLQGPSNGNTSSTVVSPFSPSAWFGSSANNSSNSGLFEIVQ